MRTARPVWHGSRPATSGVPGARRRRRRTNATRSRFPPRPGSAFVDAAGLARRNQLDHRRGASIRPKPGGRRLGAVARDEQLEPGSAREVERPTSVAARRAGWHTDAMRPQRHGRPQPCRGDCTMAEPSAASEATNRAPAPQPPARPGLLAARILRAAPVHSAVENARGRVIPPVQPADA